ncbi:hypothetical protein [Rhodococcoides fascians]|uniref:hypothetical protein n=1 Tax=Rhodococcoides fascians TaxID=1828 RepID=UPI00366D3EF1
MSAPTRLRTPSDSPLTNRSPAGSLSPVIGRRSLPNFTRFESFHLDDPIDLTATVATTEDVWSLVVDWNSAHLRVDSEELRLARLVEAAARSVVLRPNIATAFSLDYYPTHIHNEVGRRTASLTATMRPGIVCEGVLITITQDAR